LCAEGELTWKVEIRRKNVLVMGEVCVAMFWYTPYLKRRSSGFLIVGSLISVSTAPHCGMPAKSSRKNPSP